MPAAPIPEALYGYDGSVHTDILSVGLSTFAFWSEVSTHQSCWNVVGLLRTLQFQQCDLWMHAYSEIGLLLTVKSSDVAFLWKRRDAEVLSLFATIINKLKSLMTADVGRIFEVVFECTLEMITKNFEVSCPAHKHIILYREYCHSLE